MNAEQAASTGPRQHRHRSKHKPINSMGLEQCGNDLLLRHDFPARLWKVPNPLATTRPCISGFTRAGRKDKKQTLPQDLVFFKIDFASCPRVYIMLAKNNNCKPPRLSEGEEATHGSAIEAENRHQKRAVLSIVGKGKVLQL